MKPGHASPGLSLQAPNGPSGDQADEASLRVTFAELALQHGTQAVTLLTFGLAAFLQAILCM
jgi:hypothetical protein